ncbi:N-acetyltransferase [Pseudooceanicola sediminis]|uniref:N-acetyltransferase n=1 Tax=Pseudooceanicola sediminis TaxID=2211117 RepID=A0A399IZK8_9RHOB|nr:GNAT family N-acetyltransferase [Pseudooceanicola sediminis]KAA2313571.1 GNAT family N-acetyltransferase [Puniceibacterium sp. HSS470]RII38583.1 N-acetyltransferase [Pseudooceanicola sediminis]|tara:strand:- start:21185 stop:21730 length:546 start_codon:yes stop_codon:yes gene_type:complete
MTVQIPTLTSERLTLRGPDARDIDALSAFYASDRSRFVGGPMNREQTWRQLATEIGHWTLRGYGRWMVDLTATGATVGMVGLWNPEGWPEPEIGWDLMNGHEGHGYATEAALTARAYAYDVLGWSTAISLVKPGNDGSAHVALRLGARMDGEYSHVRFGHLDIYRHPAPADLVNGGAEAYA